MMVVAEAAVAVKVTRFNYSVGRAVHDCNLLEPKFIK